MWRVVCAFNKAIGRLLLGRSSDDFGFVRVDPTEGSTPYKFLVKIRVEFLWKMTGGGLEGLKSQDDVSRSE
jgi:hypothetical protein